MAAGDGDPVGRYRWESGHDCGSGLGAAHYDAVTSRVPRWAPEPERRSRHDSAQLLRRCADVHLDDRRSTEPHYTSIAQARSDGNNARVWGGMHYPSTVAISDAEGEAIANWVNQNSMQRLRKPKNERP